MAVIYFNTNLCFVRVKYNPKKTTSRCPWLKMNDINEKRKEKTITVKFKIVLENNVLAVCANKGTNKVTLY